MGPGRVAACFAMCVGALLSGCATRARMCTPGDCAAGSSCVAGRCQRDGSVAKVQATRRMLLAPDAMAYVRAHDDGPAQGGALPTTFTLGRAADGDARLYLRFSVPLPPNLEVVEAFLLLEREPGRVEEEPLALHVDRVIAPWDPGGVEYARQPASVDDRLPEARVTGRRLVRLDVRELVRRWRKHDRNDQGLVLSVRGSSPSGVTFALAPAPLEGSDPPPVRPLFAAEPLRPVGADDLRASQGASRPPTLELYVRWADP